VTGANPLLVVEGLVKRYPVRRGLLMRTAGWIDAAQGVSFSIGTGTTLGLVGESGCGKTTVGRCVLRLVEPDEGSVTFDGLPVLAQGEGELRALRRRMQMAFQDPYTSLNPRMTIGQALAEPLVAHGIARGTELQDRVAAALNRVGLDPALAGRFPHGFSGGQRQRINIARALVLGPEFLVCDEVVSALDVSVQAQILNLLVDLQEEHGLTYLFISHDLAVVRHLCTHVAVMYRGRLVEVAPAGSLFDEPRHPYTELLLRSVPGRGKGAATPNAPRGPDGPDTGCPFAPRCPLAADRCHQGDGPQLEEVGALHHCACWLRTGGGDL